MVLARRVRLRLASESASGPPRSPTCNSMMSRRRRAHGERWSSPAADRDFPLVTRERWVSGRVVVAGRLSATALGFCFFRPGLLHLHAGERVLLAPDLDVDRHRGPEASPVGLGACIETLRDPGEARWLAHPSGVVGDVLEGDFPVLAHLDEQPVMTPTR